MNCFARVLPNRDQVRSAMRWFRSHSFGLTSVALLALACQFVLSFGHIHLDRTAGFSSGRAIAAAVGSAIAAPDRTTEDEE